MIEGYRLSPQQKHLWALYNQDHHLPYESQVAVLIEGSPDIARLEAALRYVIAEHETFHTAFQTLPGMSVPLQVLVEPNLVWESGGELDLPYGPELEAQIGSLLAEARENVQFLSSTGRIQAKLIRLQGDDHLLLLTLPALQADQMTLRKMVPHLAHAYEAGLGPDHQPSEEMPQYIEISEWLNDLVESEDAEAGKAFWREQRVVDALELKLPLGKRPPQVPRFQHTKHRRGQIPDALARRVEQAAEANGASLPAFCLVLWQILLYRLSGNPHIVVGTAFDGRVDDELQQVMGPLGRFLPIDAQLSDELRLSEVIAQANAKLEQAFPWQECFSWDELHGGKDKQEKFFPMCFEYEEKPQAFQGGGVAFRSLRQYVCNDRFDVKLACIQSPGHLSFTIHYDADQMSCEAIQRLAEQYEAILESAVAETDPHIGRLNLICESQMTRLQPAIHGPEMEPPAIPLVNAMLDEQIAKNPTAPALADDHTHLDFGGLGERIATIANALLADDLVREDRVGLLVNRGVDSVAGIFGIFAAGGMYVPLDSEFPRERLAYMLEDAEVSVVITTLDLANSLQGIYSGKVLCLDRDLEGVSATAPNRAIDPEAGAYMIYTSGSTGKPKGTVVSHRALACHAHSCIDHYELTPADRVLAFASFNFDASLEQAIPPLLAGASVLVRGADIWGTQGIVERIKNLDLSVVNFPTAYWQMLTNQWFETKATDGGDRLRLIIAGGDTMQLETVRRWQETLFGDRRLLNGYGPTEATITATTFDVPDSEALKNERVPIGRPMANRTTYVLSRSGSLCPPGVAGELLIGGDCLARGYVNRPGLTAERFVPDPFSTQPGGRLYRTGDLARYLDKGLIQFLGRNDDQVKIRGYRIELGEIEHMLHELPGVSEAVVVAHHVQRAPGEKRLVAYYIPDGGETVTATTLRDQLADRLPKHMVPGILFEMDKFPLSPTGKVDRKSLPEPDMEFSRAAIEVSVAPRTRTERVLARMWAELLDVPKVGAMDDFFKIGGHSLNAMQLVSRVRKVFNVELPLKEIFPKPHLHEVAALIDRLTADKDGLIRPELAVVPRTERMPLSFAQQRLWLVNKLNPGNPAYNVPTAIRIRGPLDHVALEQAIQEIVKRHEVLRTTFGVEGDEPYQTIHPYRDWRMETVNLTELDSAEYDAAIAEHADAHASLAFDLTTGPLLRARLLQFSETDNLLLFAMHHIVSDGWSIGVLVHEALRLYLAFSEGRSNPLPQLAFQYVDYAVWQRAWMQGDVYQTELAHWRDTLKGLPARQALPLDSTDVEKPSNAAGTAEIRLDAEQTSLINERCQSEDITLFMFLIAGFNVMLHSLTDAEDIALGTDVANRNRAALEDLIGFFINQVVIRSDLSGDPSFRDLLGRVRDRTLAAYAHQDIPFDKVVEELNPVRDAATTPFFQAKFVLQNAPGTKLELPGLEFEPLPPKVETTKLNLQLNMWRDGDELAGLLKFKTDLFREATARKMNRVFKNILIWASEAPEQTLSQLKARVQKAEKAARKEKLRKHQSRGFNKFKARK